MNGRFFTRVILGSVALLGACADDALDGAAAPATAQEAASGAVRVELDDGSLDGVREGATNKFLGIPYAKPPVGALRWKRPEKNDSWSGARDASKFGKRCAQLASTTLQNPASQDEDCLYLNVWSTDLKPAAPKAVMVFIHGGGNVNGSASETVPYTDPSKGTYFYAGGQLAADDVVVVTFNYRLGVLGFFAHPGLTAEQSGGGNQGLFDQALALDWVKRNIAKFGGDPQKVTIFGESAGSQDVCLHVASPVSRGLFHRAISESGGCTSLNNTKAFAEQTGQRLATALGCTGDDALTCLRNAPVEKLLSPGATPALTFGPIVDGTFMPDQPRTLYTKGDIAKVPYILGSNTDEGTLFVPATVADEAALRAAVTAQFGAANVDPILQMYPPSKFASPRETLARIVGDAVLVCSTYDTATLAQAAGSKVWMYNFDIPATLPPGVSAPRLGATHGSELVYVFGTSTIFDVDAARASAQIRGYWTNFAKTGAQEGPGALPWPAWTPESNKRLNFGTPFSVVEGFRAPECAFWRARYQNTFNTATAAPTVTVPR